MNKSIILSAIVMALIFSAAPANAGDHGHKEGDINIGVSGAGQLVIEWSGEQVLLPELGGPLFGFGLDEPGFFTIDQDEPDEDIFVLDPGANVVLEVINFDAALQGWRPGFASTFENPGDTWNIGPAPFDTHAFWHIVATDPLFVAPPGHTNWSATSPLLDTGSTGYAASEPVTVTFTPEPGTLGLLAFATVAMIRRRAR